MIEQWLERQKLNCFSPPMMIGNYHIGEDVKARWLGILSGLSGKGDKTVIRSNL